MKNTYALAIVSLTLSMTSKGQVITTGSIQSENVFLMPSTSPEFASALHPQRDLRLDVLLPYSVLIKNDSDRAIIAYSIRWMCEDSTGKRGFPEVTPFDFSAFPSSNSLRAHHSELVSNVSFLGSQHLRWPRVQQDVEALLHLFRKQKSIHISLEAVLFEDGTAAGLDRNSWIPRWEANIDAEHDVFSTVSQNQPDLRDYLVILRILPTPISLFVELEIRIISYWLRIPPTRTKSVTR